MFVSDEPITNQSEDILKRGAFVADLGNAILNWNWKQALTIGIEGEWGTGKTSVINLLSEMLRNDVTIVRFAPWNWSDPEHLNRAFFAELIDKGNFKKNVIKQIFEYVELLEPFDKRIEIGLGLIKKLLGFKNLSTQGIEGTKAEVKKHIESTEKKFLVFIDDLDRLTPAELLEVFKLVRSNADFANIVYVLAYQRSIVIKHLDKEFFPGNSDKYLEKIIQFPINLPEIDRGIIHSILENEITSIVGNIEINPGNQYRLSELFYFYLLDKIHNMRDVKRYVSHIKFAKAMHQNEDELEVNVVDLLALSAIKIFSPVTYEDIYRHRNLLLGEELNVSKEDLDIAAERARKLTGEKTAKRILKFLFPDIENVVEGKKESYRYGNGEEAFINKRICHSKLFDRYFQMHIPAGDVSFRKMKTFIYDLTNDYKLVEKYKEEPDLEKLILRVKYYLNESRIYGSNTLYRNLIQLGDIVSDQSEGLLARSPFSDVCYCLRKVLIEERSSDSDRSDVLLSAFHGSSSYAVIARLLNSEWWARQEDKKGQESFLGGQGLKRLKEVWLDDLADMSIKKPGIILQIPALEILLIQWEKEAGDTLRIKKWVHEIPHEKETFFTLLKAFSQNTSRGLRVDLKEMNRYLKMKMSNLQNLCRDDALDQTEETLFKAYQLSIRETANGSKELEL